MRKVSIISDSTSDLSPELRERYHIDTFPLHIHLGEKEYSDGVDITPDEIYTWSDINKATPKTSVMSPAAAEEVLARHLAESEEVICFCISEKMSSSANVMRLGAAGLEAEDRVHVINSKNLSTGIGLQIIEAAIMAELGMTAGQIVENIKQLQPHVHASFVIETLTYLYRGGRCSGLAALAGGALKLHPCISVIDGKMLPGKKYRGKMNKVIEAYVEDLMPYLRKARKERVFITHSGCDADILKMVHEKLEALDYFEEIHETRAGGVITSHCGPGTLGVLFIEE